jgi:hypothetical protein
MINDRRRPADVRIDVQVGGSRTQVTLTSSYCHNSPLRIDVDRSTAALEARLTIRKSLDEVRTAVKDKVDLSWEASTKALLLLHRAGARLGIVLFGTSFEAVRVAEFLREALLKHEAQGFEHPPILYVSAPKELMYPVEFIRLGGDHRDRPAFRTFLELREAASHFVAFSFIVRRMFRGREILPVDAFESPARIAFFHDATLVGASKELALLQKKSGDTLEVDGPWPVGEDPDIEDFFDLAFDPHLRLHGVRDNRPYDMLHFACHCETRSELANDYMLRLASAKYHTVDIKVGDLEEAFYERALNTNRSAWVRPLIFMNACGASYVEPFTSASFPAFFLAERYLGFVGTETEVDDDLAAEFAGYFYSSLIDGMDIGRALHTARWSLLRHDRNPLGVLWTLYADPGLRLVPPPATPRVVHNWPTAPSDQGRRPDEA